MTMAHVRPRTICAECGDIISDSHAWVVDWWHPPELQSQFRHVVCDHSKRAIGINKRRRTTREGEPQSW